MESEHILYIVKTAVDLNVEQEWTTWHTKTHIPDVLKQPGFLKATRLRQAGSRGEKPVYWTVYEMRTIRAYQEYTVSVAAGKLRSEHEAKFGNSVKLERFLLVDPLEIENDEHTCLRESTD